MFYDVAIIGGGVVGASTAYWLSQEKCSVVLLEAENDVAMGTSKANSAIVHAGYDPEPGTLMARLNAEGNTLVYNLCEQFNVPVKQCGSLVLAFHEKDLAHLEKLLQRGINNGIPGLRLLSGEETKALEPNLADNVVGSLYAPTAGIVSPWELTLALAENAAVNGVDFLFNHKVTAIRRENEAFALTTVEGKAIQARFVVNAAGVHSEEVAQMIETPSFHIRPTRGEYYLLDKSQGDIVSHVIFQCPDEKGKGVLVSPTVHGNLIVGPNAEVVEDPNDVSTTAKGLLEVSEKALHSVPGLRFQENIRNFAGMRANTNVDEFQIYASTQAPGMIHLAGIKSPGLTAAPAIGKMAVELLRKEGLVLEKKEEVVQYRRKSRIKELPKEEIRKCIEENPLYGRVICRCESITEGEIVDAIHEPIPARTIAGVKRRCNAGMGRCQGGFCSPRVAAILARERNISMTQVLDDREGSFVLTGETKGGEANG